MSGKNSYLQLELGPSLQKVKKPGKLCLESGECGWLVIPKRRNTWYVYLDAGKRKDGKRDIYLGPLAGFQPVPVSLIIRYAGDGKLQVDIPMVPSSPQKLIGTVKSLAVITAYLPGVEKLLNQILVKYKLR